MRRAFLSVSTALVVSLAASGCATTGGESDLVKPVLPAVDAELAVPCQEAAGDKYFMDPDRVIAVSSEKSGANTDVVLKVDTRDAVCTLNAKGKVVSLVDTSPKSADQIAAEELKAAEAGATDGADAKKPVKKPVAKKKG